VYWLALFRFRHFQEFESVAFLINVPAPAAPVPLCQPAPHGADPIFPETCLVATSVNPACVKPLGSEKIVGTGIHLSANATSQELALEIDLEVDLEVACAMPTFRA
jgi:hypothetical protein